MNAILEPPESDHILRYSNNILISKKFQPTHNMSPFRRSGRECRNPEAKEGLCGSHPLSLDTGNPCRYDGI